MLSVPTMLELDVIYRFGEALIDDADLTISSDGINIPGFAREIVFAKENPWSDMASVDRCSEGQAAKLQASRA